LILRDEPSCEEVVTVHLLAPTITAATRGVGLTAAAARRTGGADPARCERSQHRTNHPFLNRGL